MPSRPEALPLVFRQEQAMVFRDAGLADFRIWMVDHLRRHFPDEMKGRDDDLRAFVRRGIDKAWSYGIRETSGICQLIDVMVFFGENFDTDPRYPWAHEILTSGLIADPNLRSETLILFAIEELKTGHHGGDESDSGGDADEQPRAGRE